MDAYINACTSYNVVHKLIDSSIASIIVSKWCNLFNQIRNNISYNVENKNIEIKTY